MGSPALMNNEQFQQAWQGWVMTMICSQAAFGRVGLGGGDFVHKEYSREEKVSALLFQKVTFQSLQLLTFSGIRRQRFPSLWYRHTDKLEARALPTTFLSFISEGQSVSLRGCLLICCYVINTPPPLHTHTHTHTSPAQQKWVWANSRRWWRTRKPGMLQSMGSQRVRYSLVTEQQQPLYYRDEGPPHFKGKSWGEELTVEQLRKRKPREGY